MSDLNLSFLQSLTRRSWFSLSTRNIQCLEATKNSRVLTMLPVQVLVHLRIICTTCSFTLALPFVQNFCGACQVCGAQWWRSAGVFVMWLHTAIPRISIIPLSCPSHGRYCHNAFCMCLMSGVEQSFCGHGLWWKRKSPQNSYDFKSMLVCVLGGSLSI
jgi:hypothetical protein